MKLVKRNNPNSSQNLKGPISLTLKNDKTLTEEKKSTIKVESVAFKINEETNDSSNLVQNNTKGLYSEKAISIDIKNSDSALISQNLDSALISHNFRQENKLLKKIFYKSHSSKDLAEIIKKSKYCSQSIIDIISKVKNILSIGLKNPFIFISNELENLEKFKKIQEKLDKFINKDEQQLNKDDDITKFSTNKLFNDYKYEYIDSDREKNTNLIFFEIQEMYNKAEKLNISFNSIKIKNKSFKNSNSVENLRKIENDQKILIEEKTSIRKHSEKRMNIYNRYFKVSIECMKDISKVIKNETIKRREKKEKNKKDLEIIEKLDKNVLSTFDSLNNLKNTNLLNNKKNRDINYIHVENNLEKEIPKSSFINPDNFPLSNANYTLSITNTSHEKYLENQLSSETIIDVTPDKLNNITINNIKNNSDNTQIKNEDPNSLKIERESKINEATESTNKLNHFESIETIKFNKFESSNNNYNNQILYSNNLNKEGINFSNLNQGPIDEMPNVSLPLKSSFCDLVITTENATFGFHNNNIVQENKSINNNINESCNVTEIYYEDLTNKIHSNKTKYANLENNLKSSALKSFSNIDMVSGISCTRNRNQFIDESSLNKESVEFINFSSKKEHENYFKIGNSINRKGLIQRIVDLPRDASPKDYSLIQRPMTGKIENSIEKRVILNDVKKSEKKCKKLKFEEETFIKSEALHINYIPNSIIKPNIPSSKQKKNLVINTKSIDETMIIYDLKTNQNYEKERFIQKEFPLLSTSISRYFLFKK